MPQTKAIVSIENVNQITKSFVGVEYHPDQFPGLVFRFKIPETATLIFSSGKMIRTGAKSEDMARKAV
jgi:transcription initiation factor TFIID TATA-box-binding protein